MTGINPAWLVNPFARFVIRTFRDDNRALLVVFFFMEKVTPQVASLRP